MDALRRVERRDRWNVGRVLKDRQNPFEDLDNEEFTYRYRFSKENVLALLEAIKDDSTITAKRSNSVPLYLQLLTTLRFYATGNFQTTDGDLVGLHQTTVCRIVQRISRCIARKKSLFIQLPSDLIAVKQEFFSIAGFPNVVGAIDCTHIPITSPGGEQAEVFRNRKGYFSVNVQATCTADRVFSNVVARWPGSTHDSRIFQNSVICDKLECGEINGFLLGDSGYACKHYLMTPLLNPSSENERRYNRSHVKTRGRIEQAFGVLKQRFRCLRTPLRTKISNSLVIIVAVFCLHNYAVRRSQPLLDDEDQDSDCEESLLQQPSNAVAVPTLRGRSVREGVIRQYF